MGFLSTLLEGFKDSFDDIGEVFSDLKDGIADANQGLKDDLKEIFTNDEDEEEEV